MTATYAKPVQAIRPGTLSDLPAILAMFRQFIQTADYREYIGDNPTQACAYLTHLLTVPDATILVSTLDEAIIGMLGLLVFPHPMSGERVGQEMFWWLDPRHRGYGGWLLKRGEKWASEQGATRLQMMSPASNARVSETYERLGYTRVEVIYQKDLA